eukprot:TRINITY_DN11573_c0_g1_i1.p1 TRINITY_DN11573_c0_g1~~TRINITY_DN11573_c0_g1_i1.p1  ORF type:complete len:179 (+),score=29.97 TRINITY_DN11573_c0_g1_i1:921-1457(+)
MSPAAYKSPREVPITFDSVRDKNVQQLRKINTSIFPVRYQDKFYADAVNAGELTKLAFYGDLYVGAMACRIEKKPMAEGDEPSGAPGNRVYIMTLGVLAPYRRLGVGSKLLKHCIDVALQDPSLDEIFLHVQINNEEALAFYNKFGFSITETVYNYYKRIEPPHCYILTKKLERSSSK